MLLNFKGNAGEELVWDCPARKGNSRGPLLGWEVSGRPEGEGAAARGTAVSVSREVEFTVPCAVPMLWGRKCHW